MMDEQGFLSRMFDKYNLSEFSIEVQTPKYKNGLLANLDYYKLWQYIELNCKSMPAPGEINRIAKNKNYFLNAKCPALQHIEELRKLPKFDINSASDEWKRRIKDVYKRVGYKSCIKELQ